MLETHRRTTGKRSFIPFAILCVVVSFLSVACDQLQKTQGGGPIITPPGPGAPPGPGVPPGPGPNPPPTSTVGSISGQIIVNREADLTKIEKEKEDVAAAQKLAKNNRQPTGGSSVGPTEEETTGETIYRFKNSGEFQKFDTQLADTALPKGSKRCGLMQAVLGPQLTAINDDSPFKKMIDDLKAHDQIEEVENYIRKRQFSSAPKDQYYPKQWDLRVIGIPEARELITGSAEVIVAVIDTGIKKDHPDFSDSHFVRGFDFITSTTTSNDGTGPDGDPDDPGDDELSFHGTHVTGTIAASINNLKSPNPKWESWFAGGIAGIAPEVKIMPLRVLGVGGGTDWDIAQAILFAAKLRPDTEGKFADKRADIINMSFGGPGPSSLIDDALEKAYAAGVTLVAAAGNDNSGNAVFPAANKRVIAVGSLGPTSQGRGQILNAPYPDGLALLTRAAEYSNFGVNLDIMAPGGIKFVSDENFEIYSTLWSMRRDGSGNITYSEPVYRFYQGTSMASPHVAAVAALVKMAFPDVTPVGIRSILYATAQAPNGVDPNNAKTYYGHGLMDAFRAVQLAKQLNKQEDLVVNLVLRPVNNPQQKPYVIKINKNNNFGFEMENVQPGKYELIAGTDMVDPKDNFFCLRGDLCGKSNQIDISANNQLQDLKVEIKMMLDDSLKTEIGGAS